MLDEEEPSGVETVSARAAGRMARNMQPPCDIHIHALELRSRTISRFLPLFASIGEYLPSISRLEAAHEGLDRRPQVRADGESGYLFIALFGFHKKQEVVII